MTAANADGLVRHRAAGVPRSVAVHPVVGVLDDGTPYFAPVGQMVIDGPRVMCHLCGHWYRSVIAHLRVHGWDQTTYRGAFGLQRSQPMEGVDTRDRRASAMRVRRVTDQAVRAGCEAGYELARSGALTRCAAEAAQGRRQPEQQRRKTLKTLASIRPEARADGTRRFRQEQLRRTAADAAAALGFPDIGTLVRHRIAAGASLATISREAGLHKDWLCRHLDKVDPGAARAAREREIVEPVRRDRDWVPIVQGLGFVDLGAYLADRHLTKRMSVNASAAEAGRSREAVTAAMDRHGIPFRPHASVRALTDSRAAKIAARFGFDDIRGYLIDRRQAGMSWARIASECGEPTSWVRRRAGLQ